MQEAAQAKQTRKLKQFKTCFSILKKVLNSEFLPDHAQFYCDVIIYLKKFPFTKLKAKLFYLYTVRIR